jgi:uncharacterized phage protein gp47/JayE
MATPTRNESITQVRQDLSAEGVSQVWIRRSFEYALATVVGALLWVWYSAVDKLVKQCTPLRATGVFLDWWAGIWGLTRATESTAGGGIFLSGTVGAVQPAGSIIVGPDGQEYTTDAEATIEGSGLVEVEMTAAASGTDYNLAIAAPVTVASPGAGVSSAAFVDLFGITGGQTAENDDALRERLLARIRRPAGAGTDEDWRTWTREALAAVSRVWVYGRGREGNEGGVLLIMFAVAGGPVPSAGQVATVAAALAARRISGMKTLSVSAPTGQAITFTIALDPSYDTTANRTLVQGYLDDWFLSAASPGGTLANLDCRAALARAGIAYQLQSVAGGAGTDPIVPTSLLHLPTRGTITWGTWA